MIKYSSLFRRYVRPPILLRSRMGQTFATLPPGLRIYVIGDIHGRDDCLLDLFSRIETDKIRYPVDNVIEVYVGDYIDRGAGSSLVVDLLIQRRLTHYGVHLLGNHEWMLLAALRNPKTAEAWRRSGAIETLASYGVASTKGESASAAWQDDLSRFFAALPFDHLEFLRTCRISYACGSYFFCHAGILPGVSLDQQASRDLLWIRQPFLSSKADHGAIIVHGHTPVGAPEFRSNRINVDTGAYASGYLTCVALEGNEAIPI